MSTGTSQTGNPVGQYEYKKCSTKIVIREIQVKTT